MTGLRYNIRTDWLFYLLVAGYAYLIVNMTFKLWFAGGINVFASYSTAVTATEMLVDANKDYWSKTCFLFGILLLMGLNVDFRAAAGFGAVFWSGSLIAIFSLNPILMTVLVLGALVVGQQIRRKEVFSERRQ